MRHNLEKLLAEKSFIEKHVPAMPLGRRTLYDEPELGLSRCRTLMCRNRRRTTTAHHGPYETDMTEWRRTKLKGAGAGLAEIEVVPRHRVDRGHAGTYDVPAPLDDYPRGARLVRVTGTDLIACRASNLTGDPRSRGDRRRHHRDRPDPDSGIQFIFARSMCSTLTMSRMPS